MSKQLERVRTHSDFDTPESNYFDSKPFKALKLAVAGYVRLAEKTGQQATMRFLREQIGTNQWLHEAVEACEAEGLIQNIGKSVQYRIFVTGGHEIKPSSERSGYSKHISAVPHKAEYVDLGLRKD